MLRVLFVTDHIHYPQGGGGGERNTHDLCLALETCGTRPAVASSFSMDGSRLSWSSRIRRALPPRTEYPRDKRCGYPTFRGWRFAGLSEVVRRFRPDVAVIQSTRPSPLLRALAPSGVRLFLYVHEVEDIEPLTAAAEQGLTFLANSRFTAGRLRDQFGIKAAIIRPLIDPAAYRVLSRRPTSALFVNTVPRKGLDVVLRLAASRPDIPFELVTSWILKPPQVAELKARADAIGNITLHPPTRDMRPLYSRARILLVPSQWEEAWGRVATEAQLNGIPVLASDRGGLPEAVGGGGTLVAADAPHEVWLEALAALWDDMDAYCQAATRASAHARRPEIQPRTIVGELLEQLVS